MFKKKKKFIQRNIGATKNYTSYKDMIKPRRSSGWFSKIFFVCFCIILVLFLGRYIVSFAQFSISQITKGTVGILSKSIGQEMKKDEFGNINVLIVWYGGTGHAWAFLADSIMVASFNPQLWAVTMISIPRDLYVNEKQWGIIGRINEVFAVGVGRNRDFATWAAMLSTTIQEILGIKVPYYALLDFGGFKHLIDTLGWVTVDVPESFSDSTYPTPDNGYMTVSFSSWVQQMSGEKALEYARSRHSTSDFSRSLRQQLIVNALIQKLKDQGISNITKIKSLYAEYTKIVKTNIALKEMIGLGKYVYQLKHMFSYGLTTECSNIVAKFSHPWCFLYTPSRDLFGWASIMIPDGGTPGNVSFYEYTQKFGSYVAHNQSYQIENPRIMIMNWIDKTFAKKTLKKADGFANQLAVKLKKYAFNIIDTQNFIQPISGTTLYVLSTGQVNHTIESLQDFVPNIQVFQQKDQVGFEDLTGIDLVLVLGNDYISSLVQQPFNYYK